MSFGQLCLLLIGILGTRVDYSSAFGEDVTVAFYYNDPNNPTLYHLSELKGTVDDPHYRPDRKTVFYAHGYVESLDSSTVKSIVNAYITRGTYNILILDWSSLVSGTYPDAIANSNQLGPALALAFLDVFSSGMDYRKLHLVGHSLGGQLVGLIGRSITQFDSNLILERISACDPALPGYYPPVGTVPISASDARFVDVIHTDAGGYGATVSTGTVDFWVNNGTRFQPGCPEGVFPTLSPEDTCSHQRSVALWAESVARPASKFYSHKCYQKCPEIQMGIDCKITSQPGDYCLETNSASPYSK